MTTPLTIPPCKHGNPGDELCRDCEYEADARMSDEEDNDAEDGALMEDVAWDQIGDGEGP